MTGFMSGGKYHRVDMDRVGRQLNTTEPGRTQFTLGFVSPKERRTAEAFGRVIQPRWGKLTTDVLVYFLRRFPCEVEN